MLVEGATEDADCIIEEDNATGAMQFVHIVDVDVLRIVESTVATTFIGEPFEGVIVLVTGWDIVVVCTLLVMLERLKIKYIGLVTYILVVTIAWVCGAITRAVAFETGATHLVHSVDIEVLSIVERTVVRCVVRLPPERVIVLVTGQDVSVVWTL